MGNDDGRSAVFVFPYPIEGFLYEILIFAVCLDNVEAEILKLFVERLRVHNVVDLAVYLQDGQTLYEYTDISVQELPEELQEEIISGKRIETTEELYGFLENYSS